MNISQKAIRRIKAISHWHIDRHVLRLALVPENSTTLEHFKHWVIPSEYVRPGAICYCAGVGENVDLELRLVEHYGARVFALDPTPRAIRFIENLSLDAERLTFLPVGLWSEDVTLRFYEPDNPLHVSHSVVEDHASGKRFFEAPCKTLSTLMRENGHAVIDMLKMNIEGAEYEVLGKMIEDEIRPRVLMFTIEGKNPLLQGIRWTKRLREYGYRLVGLDKWAATFVIS
jgi:FkbM family methyltransferase